MTSELSNIRVLIADDDSTMRLFMVEIIRQIGGAAIEAPDGTDAVRLFSEKHPDLILMDLIMQEMDGFEACAAIRKLPGGQDVPILMITGLDDPQSIQKAFDSGATDFIVKPFHPVLLQYRVRFLLRAHQVRTALDTTTGLLRRAERIAQAGTWEWNFTTGQVLWSPEIRKILVGPEPGEGMLPTLPHFLDGSERDAVMAVICDAIQTGQSYVLEHQIVRLDGTARMVYHEGTARKGADGSAVLLGTMQDITDRKNLEERVRKLSFYDPVTQLPNRLLLREQIEKTIAGYPRDHKEHAVVVIAIRNLKEVYESFGTEYGDRALIEVAQRIWMSVRAVDTVGRIGDFEIAIVVNGTAREEEITGFCTRIIEVLDEGIEFAEGHDLFPKVSIGVARFPSDGNNENVLIINAMSASVKAAREGVLWKYYEEGMNQTTVRRLALEGDLRKAFDRDEFVLYYQPQINLLSGRVIGVEALVRWRSGTRGLVPPNEFIPLAEESGLIGRLGEWVLRTACRQGARWNGGGRGIQVAVNLSAVQFENDRLVDLIAQILEETGFPSGLLELELTESMVMQTPDRAAHQLNEIRNRGIRTAIDDFGTGYSSLSYLRKFPIHALKVDRSFVSGMTHDADGRAIVKAVIELAHTLNMKVVAEGVETAGQLALLREMGCDVFQGFLASRPEPSDAVERFFGEWRLDISGGA